MTSTRHNPGPGAYDPKTYTNAAGVYAIAGIKNSKAPNFSLPSLPRFIYAKDERNPGPGSYSIKVGISDNSSQFISTVKSPKTNTFYHSDRITIDIPTHIRSKYWPLFWY